MFLLENFSNEVLEVVLGHIDIPLYLKDLTEVSPRFNNIISSSFRLMRRVVITWNSKKDSQEVPSKQRKYIFVEIYSVEGCSAQLKKFFETFAENFIGIRFWNCTFKASELHALLSMATSRLEELCFSFMTIVEQDSLPKIEMAKLKYLKFFTHSGLSRIWPMSSMVTTHSLESIWYSETTIQPAASEDAAALLDLIKRQKNLRMLGVRDAVMNAVVEYYLEQKQFKVELETLKLEFPFGQHEVNFSPTWKFVRTQMESLTKLRVEHAYFQRNELQILLSLRVKVLKLYYCSLKWNGSDVIKNRSIETLQLFQNHVTDDTCDAIVTLLSSCEGVTSLEFDFEKYDDRLAPVLAAIAGKRSITSLTSAFAHCLNGTAFPEVKAVTIDSFREREDLETVKKGILELVVANPQLSSLKINHKLESDADFKTLLQCLLPTTTTMSFEYIDGRDLPPTCFPTPVGFGIDTLI